MERQKLLHEYTEEELLKLLGEPTTEVTTSNEEDQIKNDVVRFVLFYDIKPGEENVNSKLLYKLYKSWSPLKKDKATINQFNSIFLSIFARSHTSAPDPFKYPNRTFYRIDKSISHLFLKMEQNRRKKIHIRSSKNYKRYAEEFMEMYNIKPGSLYVEADLLYHIFDNYQYTKKRKIISENNFRDLFSLYLPTKRTEHYFLWFGVDESIKNLLTPELVNNWRQGRVKYGKKKTKERAKKVYSKIDEKFIYPEINNKKDEQKK